MDFLLSGELGLAANSSSSILKTELDASGSDFFTELQAFVEDGEQPVKQMFSQFFVEEDSQNSKQELSESFDPEQLLDFLQQSEAQSQDLSPRAQDLKLELEQLVAGAAKGEGEAKDLSSTELKKAVEQLLQAAILGDKPSEAKPVNQVAMTTEVAPSNESTDKRLLADRIHQALAPAHQQKTALEDNTALVKLGLSAKATPESDASLSTDELKLASSAAIKSGSSDDKASVTSTLSAVVQQNKPATEKSVVASVESKKETESTPVKTDKVAMAPDAKFQSSQPLVQKSEVSDAAINGRKAEAHVSLTPQEVLEKQSSEVALKNADKSSAALVASASDKAPTVSSEATQSVTTLKPNVSETQFKSPLNDKTVPNEAKASLHSDIVSSTETPKATTSKEVPASSSLHQNTVNVTTQDSERQINTKVEFADAVNAGSKQSTQELEQQQQVLQRGVLHQELRDQSLGSKPEAVMTAAERNANARNVQAAELNPGENRRDGEALDSTVMKSTTQQDSQQGAWSQGQSQQHQAAPHSTPTPVSSTFDINASATKEAASVNELRHSSPNQNAEVNQRINLMSQQAPNQLNERVQYMLGQGMQRAEIRLDPADLGSIHIKIQMNNEQASVQIQAQNPQAREMLEQTMPRLREMLQQQGIDLGQANVNQQGQQSGSSSDHGHAKSSSGQGGASASAENDVNVVQENSNSYHNDANNERIDFYA